MAALIIANFNFESDAKRYKRKNLTNAIFSEFTVSQDILRRVIDSVLFNISTLNSLPTLLYPKKFIKISDCFLFLAPVSMNGLDE